MRNSKKGFTIIEMVIVIAIIGILATVLIPTYGNVVASANESAALQTCRSVMTNWLASSTSSSGVPTSGPDGKGGTLYAAYFEYNNNGTKYQYRYTSGGVERTDNDLNKYVNFAELPVIATAYLNISDPNFDSATYAVKVFDLEKEASDHSKYHVYYIMYPSGNVSETSNAKYAYDFGGATVYAATSDSQKIYLTTGKDAQAITIADAAKTNKFSEPQNTPAATTYTITYNVGSSGLNLETNTATTNASGKLTSLPELPTDYKWFDAETAGNVVTTDTVFTKDTTIYAHK